LVPAVNDEHGRYAALIESDIAAITVQIENRRSAIAVESAELEKEEKRLAELEALLRVIRRGDV
jgi:hypothetical protein